MLSCLPAVKTRSSCGPRRCCWPRRKLTLPAMSWVRVEYQRTRTRSALLPSTQNRQTWQSCALSWVWLASWPTFPSTLLLQPIHSDFYFVRATSSCGTWTMIARSRPSKMPWNPHRFSPPSTLRLKRCSRQTHQEKNGLGFALLQK